MEKVRINGRGSLEGRLWLTKYATSAIVIAHSFRNNMDEPACSEAEEKFAKRGYNVLTFNFRGHGNSDGRLRELSYRAVAEDMSSAIKYIRDKGFESVGTYAISLGAIASVLSAKKTDSQVFLSPTPLYYPQGLLDRYSKSIDVKQLEAQGYSLAVSGSGRGSFEIGKEWVDEMRNESGEVLQTHTQRKVPTLIIQGTEDKEGVIKARNFSKAPTDSYVELDGADHNFTNREHREIAISHALNWFNKTLN